MTKLTVNKQRGRNDPCWCGAKANGKPKKYKKCHLRSDQDPVVERPQDHLILSSEEIEGMRKACAFNAQLMDHIRPMIKTGAVLDAIDREAYNYTVEHGHRPATLGYRGFPKSLCTSVNEVICHGIPDDYVLKEGDIVNCDLTTIVDGWHGDQSETFLIGEVSDEAKKLVQCAFDCLYLGIDALKPNEPVQLAGNAISDHAEPMGYSVVREFQGHGIGRVFHQLPGVPHFRNSPHGAFILRPGMCFTVEPMINVGCVEGEIDSYDGWTCRTKDGQLSAQFEHTILMTDDGPEILTTTAAGPQRGHVF